MFAISPRIHGALRRNTARVILVALGLFSDGSFMVVRRTQEMRREGTVHPTHVLIVDSAVQLVKKKGIAEFHIDDLLEATGLTRGAIYHHFENVDQVLESALLAIYVEGVNGNIAQVRQTLASATTFDEFRDGIVEANRLYVKNAKLRELRKLRAHAMARTATSSDLAASLSREQQKLTDEYVVVITEAQRRGWVQEDLDVNSLAVFIQAYSFGIIIDDVSETHIKHDSWALLIESFFEKCVYAPQPRSTKRSS
jgi:AcrR family transcriptional regulator